MREAVDLAGALVSGGAKAHRLVQRLRLLREGVGAGGEHVAQLVRRRHDEPRRRGCVLHERGALVCRVIRHVQVVVADGADVDAAAVGDVDLYGICLCC